MLLPSNGHPQSESKAEAELKTFFELGRNIQNQNITV